MAAAAASGAPYGTPVPFPMYHPGAAMAYYAHASMAAVSLLASLLVFVPNLGETGLGFGGGFRCV